MRDLAGVPEDLTVAQFQEVVEFRVPVDMYIGFRFIASSSQLEVGAHDPIERLELLRS